MVKNHGCLTRYSKILTRSNEKRRIANKLMLLGASVSVGSAFFCACKSVPYYLDGFIDLALSLKRKI